MNFSPYNFSSIQECLTDSLLMVNDEEQKLLSPGFYRRQARRAIEELNFSTYFLVVYEDLDLPTDLNLPIPKNMWNINDIFAYNKSASDCSEDTCDNCAIGGLQRVFYKRYYLSKGNGFGYTARNHENNYSDPFINNAGDMSSVLWYNVQNGTIMFSPSCASYDKVRIVANGLMSADISEARIVPPFVREAVTLYVAEKAALALKAKDVKYRPIWVDLNSALYTKKSSGSTSVFDEALYRLKKRDKKEHDDWMTYLSKMNY